MVALNKFSGDRALAHAVRAVVRMWRGARRWVLKKRQREISPAVKHPRQTAPLQRPEGWRHWQVIQLIAQQSEVKAQSALDGNANDIWEWRSLPVGNDACVRLGVALAQVNYKLSQEDCDGQMRVGER